MPAASAQPFKQRAHALIDSLPDTVGWKDLAQEISVLQDIEEALQDSEAGRTFSNDAVRQQFGLADLLK